MTNSNQQIDKIRTQPGFIAALDRSGGSTPKALANYGISTDACGDDEQLLENTIELNSQKEYNQGKESEGVFLVESALIRVIIPKWASGFIWPLTLLCICIISAVTLISIT